VPLHDCARVTIAPAPVSSVCCWCDNRRLTMAAKTPAAAVIVDMPVAESKSPRPPTQQLTGCSIVEAGAYLAFTMAFDWLLHNPFCNVMFRCGCQMPPPFGASWIPCNVHDPEAPHCPWCSVTAKLGNTLVTLMIVTMYATYLLLATRGAPAWSRLTTPVLAWLAMGVAVGLGLLATSNGYPYFFFFTRSSSSA
jgi:hypothetical protein